ncbi:MAG: hypothetical protein WBQ64_01030 [Terriglobales bacterium]
MLALPRFNQRVLTFEATAKAADKLIAHWFNQPIVVFSVHWPALVTNVKSSILEESNRLV